jgi:hypothetical protein
MGNLAASEDGVGVSDLSTQVEKDGFAVVPGFAYGTLKGQARVEKSDSPWNGTEPTRKSAMTSLLSLGLVRH